MLYKKCQEKQELGECIKLISTKRTEYSIYELIWSHLSLASTPIFTQTQTLTDSYIIIHALCWSKVDASTDMLVM